MAAMDSIRSELAEAARIIREQNAEITRLRNEVERLMATASAHDVLREIYLNPGAPQAHRLKAAQAALNVETPRLTPVPPPLDLVAEEIVPLAQLVEQRRARQNLLCPESIEPDKVLDRLVPVAPRAATTSNGDDHS